MKSSAFACFTVLLDSSSSLSLSEPDTSELSSAVVPRPRMLELKGKTDSEITYNLPDC
jgi:hypothetical protein